jgi:hypothetical protein
MFVLVMEVMLLDVRVMSHKTAHKTSDAALCSTPEEPLENADV